MTDKLRRYTQLLEVVKEELTQHYRLNEIEQHYLFNNAGGTADQRLDLILRTRIHTYQQQQRRR